MAVETTGAEAVLAGLLDAWNAHDLERVVTFYPADYVGVSVAEATPHQGPEGARQFVSRYMQALPDLHFTTDAIVCQGEQVAWFWTARGTHLGRLMNIPPTGRPINVHGASLLTLKEGRIARAFYLWDVAALLRAMGLLPELV